MARVVDGGELVDLTEDDIRLWMFWLGLDYICTAERSARIAGDRGRRGAGSGLAGA